MQLVALIEMLRDFTDHEPTWDVKSKPSETSSQVK